MADPRFPVCGPTTGPGSPELPYPVNVREELIGKRPKMPNELAPVGRYETYSYVHQFVFTEAPLSAQFAAQVLQHVFEIGGQAQYAWHGFQLFGSNPGAPATAAGANDPLANVRIAFFTHHGTRPLQNGRVLASLYRGAGLSASADISFAPPYLFAAPMYMPKQETIRVEVEHKRPATTTVTVTLLGFRWFN